MEREEILWKEASDPVRCTMIFETGLVITCEACCISSRRVTLNETE